MQHSSGAQVLRHRLTDRFYHWSMAICMLVLLITGFLPVLGVNFGWVDPHWIAGVILTLLVLVHIIRALTVLTLSNIWIGWQEFSAAFAATKTEVLGGPRVKRRIGKYSVSQKGFHHAAALVVLVAIGTGLVMMIGIDGPFWERNPFIISESSRGMIYVLHGFAGLISITIIVIHIYFAIRPEKRYMTRSMIRGWISRAEYEQNHDPGLWK